MTYENYFWCKVGYGHCTIGQCLIQLRLSITKMIKTSDNGIIASWVKAPRCTLAHSLLCECILMWALDGHGQGHPCTESEGAIQAEWPSATFLPLTISHLRWASHIAICIWHISFCTFWLLQLNSNSVLSHKKEKAMSPTEWDHLVQVAICRQVVRW